MHITITHKGDFKKTEKFLTGAQKLNVRSILNRYGEQGVNALSLATPIDSGVTAASWSYRVFQTEKGYQISWFNSHEENGIMPAILIQYGHGTKGGTYVEGIDYINPALKPIFNKIANAIDEEVSRL